ncbi:MAG: Maf family protein [Acidiferrobacterales bacterium]
MKLVLASSSPYRQKLLQQLQLQFESISPEIDETPLPNEAPVELVQRLAIAKARAVADECVDCLVIGSDQVAVHDHEIVGKPNDHDDAVRQLQYASGKTITLYTGLALVNSRTNVVQSEVVPFTIHFRELTRDQIENYLRKDQPYNCAGSVKSESLGVALFERFEGDDPNALIGLPLIRLVHMLEKEGVSII